jgi:integrase
VVCFNKLEHLSSPGGETGRRNGLKIRFPAMGVRVQVPPRAPSLIRWNQQDTVSLLAVYDTRTIIGQDRVMLTLYRRHKKTCPHTDRYLKQDAHRCPVWVEGNVDGVYRRHSLKVSSWERAKVLAQELERGREAIRLTISEAFAKFISDCEARNLQPASVRKQKVIGRQFEEFAISKGFALLSDVTVDDIRAFRATWKDAPITSQKKLERLRAAFQFFVDCDWIAKNPARAVKSPITHLHAVEPFTVEEQSKILSTAYRLAQTQVKFDRGGLPVHPKTGTFAKLLLNTGLRITDAAMLQRERINRDRIFLYATKNNNPVTLPLPPDLAHELQEMTGDHLFQSPGGSQRPETVSDYWRDQLIKVFKAAGVENAHPHRFRHSLAVNMLNNGSSTEDVAAVLGNSPQIVAKYYSAWVSSRQQRIDAELMKTWATRRLVRVK